MTPSIVRNLGLVNLYIRLLCTTGVYASSVTGVAKASRSLSHSGHYSIKTVHGVTVEFDEGKPVNASQKDEFDKLQALLKSHGWSKSTAVGNIAGKVEGESRVLYDTLALSARTICESGFGGGHAALYSLLNFPNAQLYFFDIGSSSFAKPAAEYLQGRFLNRLHIQWGNSLNTIPAFKKAHPDFKCDFIMVDGGRNYEVAKADVLNFATLAASEDTPVLQHDCPLYNNPFAGVYKAWSELVSSGCVRTSASKYHFEGRLWGVAEGRLNLSADGPCLQPQERATPLPATSASAESDTSATARKLERRVVEIYYDASDLNSEEPGLKYLFSPGDVLPGDIQKVQEDWDVRLFPFGTSSWAKGDEGPTYTGTDREISLNQLHTCALEHLANPIPFLSCVMSKPNFELVTSYLDDCLHGQPVRVQPTKESQTLQACIDGGTARSFYIFRASSVNASKAVSRAQWPSKMALFVNGQLIDHSALGKVFKRARDVDHAFLGDDLGKLKGVRLFLHFLDEHLLKQEAHLEAGTASAHEEQQKKESKHEESEECAKQKLVNAHEQQQQQQQATHEEEQQQQQNVSPKFVASPTLQNVYRLIGLSVALVSVLVLVFCRDCKK